MAVVAIVILIPAVGIAQNKTGSVDPAKIGVEFVKLPGGTFHMGCASGDRDMHCKFEPRRRVTVQPFSLGKTEVTVAAYQACLRAGGCSKEPPERRDCNWKADRATHPINCVDWNEANEFCRWIGGRLPTAEEWEFAAKGGEERIYPWGNAPLDRRKANYGVIYGATKDEDGSEDGWEKTAPVGSFPAGASKHGLLDMAGNVWEWTASDADAALRAALRIPTGSKEFRGGGYSEGRPNTSLLRTSAHVAHRPAFKRVSLGFRCAR